MLNNGILLSILSDVGFHDVDIVNPVYQEDSHFMSCYIALPYDSIVKAFRSDPLYWEGITKNSLDSFIVNVRKRIEDKWCHLLLQFTPRAEGVDVSFSVVSLEYFTEDGQRVNLPSLSAYNRFRAEDLNRVVTPIHSGSWS